MNEIKNYAYIENLELWEYIAFPSYIILILIISYYIQSINVSKNKIYRYYTWGVAIKLLGAVAFCLVYIFYYKGGDTISYYETSRALSKLFTENPSNYFKVISEKPSVENFFIFDGRTTGYPWPYMYYDTKTFLVAKIVSPFLILSFNSYLLASLLFSWVSFIGVWKLFLMLSNYLKNETWKIAYSVLFIPSVVFWGSGIMKDTITLSASCWFIYSYHNFFILKHKRWINLFMIIVMGYIMLSIKPYIMYALLPGAIIWVFHDKIINIKNFFIRVLIIPIIYIIGIVLGLTILSSISNFDLYTSISDAIEKQSDLKKSYYKGSSFNIGETDATVGGIVKKMPIAVIAGLYRPFITESRNVVMILSGIENMVYLYFSIIILFKVRISRIFKLIFDNPILIFLFSYFILLSFIVGFSTSNFGAMVRFKIPYLPIFMSFLFILESYSKNQRPYSFIK